MHKKDHSLFSQSSFLTDSVKHYSEENFPEHNFVTVGNLQERVHNYIHKKIPLQKPGFIAFMGLPGVGKSSSVPRIQDAVQSALGFRMPQEHITYSQPDGRVLEVGGYVCKKSNAIVTTLHADHFFGALGADRREIMLQDAKTCRKLWGNPRAALRFIRDLYSGESTNVRIYTGTPEEKIQKQPRGIIEFKIHPENTTRKVIIAEGVNVGEWSDKIKRGTSIKTLKILYNISLEDSLIRILRRDHDKKGYSFHEIIHARLLEYYFIFELYILPALQDSKTVFFNKARVTPPFTQNEKRDIIAALYVAQATYLRTDSTITPEQKKFIDILSSRVIDQINGFEVVSPEALQDWKIQKIQKNAIKHSQGNPPKNSL